MAPHAKKVWSAIVAMVAPFAAGRVELETVKLVKLG